MARHLSVATVIEKNRIASDVAFIPCLRIRVKDPDTGEFAETIRVALNNEDLVYTGDPDSFDEGQTSETFVAGHFEFESRQEGGAMPQVTIKIQDHSRAVQQRMQEYGGGVEFEVDVMVLNTGNLSQPPEALETFEVVKSSASNYVVTFTLGVENPLTRSFPRRRMFRNQCGWRYKSVQCGYSGPLESCDYTLQGSNGCAAHNNTERFGGFPGLNNR